jgi:hypothetical protein
VELKSDLQTKKLFNATELVHVSKAVTAIKLIDDEDSVEEASVVEWPSI